MNFTLNQLRIFVKIVEEKNITKAADKLYLTQPAVSIQLKNFQDQFDFPLIEVINKRVYVTEFGNEIAEAAKSILEEIDTIKIRASLLQGRVTGKLKIAVVSTGKYVIPFLLTDFLKQNPEIELELDVSNRQNVIKNLEQNEVDFVLMTRLPEHIKIEAMELIPNELVMVGSSGASDGYKNDPENFLKHTSFIFRESGSATRQAMENYLNNQGITTYKQLTLTSNEAVKQAVISGMGCSIVPVIGIKNELSLGQLEIINAPYLPLKSSWYLVHLKEKKHLPAADAFKNYLISNINQLLLKYFNWKEKI